MTRVRRIALAVSAAAVAASGACTTGSEGPAEETGFAQTLDQYLEQAASAGADEEQLAILRKARETGEIPFDVYSEAVDRSLRCLREAGFAIDDWGVYEDFGIKWRGIGIPTEVEADPAEMVELFPGTGVREHRCMAEHSSWVQMAYGEQPSSIEAQEAYFEQFRDAIVACLHEQGIDVEPDLSGDEILGVAAQAHLDGTTDDVNCIAESGYMRGSD